MLRRARLPLLTLLLGLVLAPQASAQATRTWVSGVGDDANPCSRPAPCKTLAGAISKTAEYGEINAIDPGGFGAVTITKSITIDLSSVEGGVLNSGGGNGVNVAAQPDDLVVLRGLDIVGAPAGGACTAGNGIRVTSAGTVRIEDSRITQQQRGVWLTPSSPLDVLVNRVDVANNCVAGIIAEPGASGSARVSFANGTITNSGTALSAGARSEAWLGSTMIFGNALGLETLGGGTITDWGDNRISGNTADGAPTTRLAPPSGPAGATGETGAPGAAGAPGTTGATGPVALQLLLASERLKAKAGRSVKLRFVTTAAMRGTLTVTRGGKAVARVAKRVTAGASTITWNGKAGIRKARAGRYRLVLSAVGADGQRTSAEVPLKLR